MNLKIKIKEIKPVKGKYGRDAAICVLLNSKREVLLIKRTVNPRDPWSGQVSFPGGHFEKDDVYLHLTALRELREETGLDNAEIIGKLEIHHPRNFPELNVFPFICYREDFSGLRKQKEEVERFLTPEIGDLKKSKVKLNMGDKVMEEECFEFDGEIIWGMTFRILLELIDLLEDH